MILRILPLFVLALASAIKHRAPVLEIEDPTTGYQAKIREDARVADITPELHIIDGTGPVCMYRIRSLDDPKEKIPFQFRILEKDSGRAELSSTGILKCGRKYRLRIAAIRCGDEGAESEEVPLTIKVIDVNDHAPRWERQLMEITVPEGKLFDNLATVRAIDEDCESPVNEICDYRITNNAHQFTIGRQGIVRNLEPLNRSISPSHVLTIVAEDCEGLKSPPLTLSITVTEPCESGWTGTDGDLAITSLVKDADLEKSTIEIYPSAQLRTCGECEISEINASVVLHSEHLGMGCGREERATEEKRKKCGANPNSILILPHANQVKVENDDANSLQTRKPTVADEIYEFDGRANAMLVNEEKLKPAMPDRMSIGFWMLHEKPIDDEDENEVRKKENILCSSDDQRMNRHHFAIFVRHCKLEILFRREQGVDKRFRPAEWRFKAPQTCDGQWHHYTLNVDFPEIILFVDGERFVADEENSEVLDDLPMHQLKDLKTKLVVGACWHGGQQKMTQHFTGSLAGMRILPYELEPERVIRCLHECEEGLQMLESAVNSLHPGMEFMFNHDLRQITVRAPNGPALSDLVRQIRYINTVPEPLKGHRKVLIKTNIICKNGKMLEIPEENRFLLLEPKVEEKMKIILKGENRLTVKASDLKRGSNVFPTLEILLKGAKKEAKISWCRVQAQPDLNKANEYFSSPADLIGSLPIDFEHQSNGVMLKGPEAMKNFVAVLRQIHYFNIASEDYTSRKFTLTCATAEKIETVSDPFDVYLMIDHSIPSQAPQSGNEIPPPPVVLKPVEHPEQQQHHARIAQPPLMQAGYTTYTAAGSGSSAAGAVVVVVVVCVGLLLIIAGVVIFKLRGSGRRHRQRHGSTGGQLDWDDGPLNITVNPMDQMGTAEPEDDPLDEYSASEYSGSEYDSEESDEEQGPLPLKEGSPRTSTGLEWDDSALQKPQFNRRV